MVRVYAQWLCAALRAAGVSRRAFPPLQHAPRRYLPLRLELGFSLELCTHFDLGAPLGDGFIHLGDAFIHLDLLRSAFRFLFSQFLGLPALGHLFPNPEE